MDVMQTKAAPALGGGLVKVTMTGKHEVKRISIDDSLVTPYAHMVNFAVAKQFGNDFSVEATYVGRFGRDQLVRRHLAGVVAAHAVGQGQAGPQIEHQ